MHPAISIHRTTKHPSESLPLHSHEEGQLTFAAAGMVQIQTEEGVWAVPPLLAAWIPPGVQHRLEIMTDAELWIVHWSRDALNASEERTSLDRAFALRITPLLRSLLTEAISIEPGSVKADLVTRLMLYELTAMGGRADLPAAADQPHRQARGRHRPRRPAQPAGPGRTRLQGGHLGEDGHEDLPPGDRAHAQGVAAAGADRQGDGAAPRAATRPRRSPTTPASPARRPSPPRSGR